MTVLFTSKSLHQILILRRAWGSESEPEGYEIHSILAHLGGLDEFLFRGVGVVFRLEDVQIGLVFVPEGYGFFFQLHEVLVGSGRERVIDNAILLGSDSLGEFFLYDAHVIGVSGDDFGGSERERDRPVFGDRESGLVDGGPGRWDIHGEALPGKRSGTRRRCFGGCGCSAGCE